MKYTELAEIKSRGTPDFPIELYVIDNEHVRYIMPFHWHREFEIIGVEQGEFNVVAGDNEYCAHPGDVILVGSGVIHGGMPKSSVYSCVVFDPSELLGTGGLSWSRETCAVAEQPAYSFHGAGTDCINTLAWQLISSLKEKRKGYRMAAVGAVCSLFAQMSENAETFEGADRKKNSGSEKLKTVLQWIEDNYRETVTLEMLASAAGMNKGYFCDFFRKCTGKRPVEYLNMFRIDCACRMMTSENCSVTEAAFANGFNDLSYFIKMFRRYKGVSPREYVSRTGNI